MREAGDGGVLATAEEEWEWEDALEDEAGPSTRDDPGAGARYDDEQAAKRRQQEAAAAEEAAKEEDVDVDVLSQEMGELASPSKPPPPKKPKKGGDGASSSQAVELTETDCS